MMSALMFESAFAQPAVPAVPMTDPAPNAPALTETPAGGLSTEFGDVMIENLGIGRTYSLRDLVGLPLKVKNMGRGTVNLAIEVHKPEEKFITEKRRNLGFKPIPSVSWVSLTKSEFIVPSNETAFTDIVITIPDDPSFYGKKFQVSLLSRTVGLEGAFLHLGVWSHILIGILPSPEAQAEMEKNRSRGIKTGVDISLIPDKIYLEKVPRGRPYNIRKETKKTIKFATSGENSFDILVKPIYVGNSPLSLQSGFQDGPPEWLKLSSDRFTLSPDELVDPGLVLHVPNDPTVSGKKFMFLLKVDPADPDAVGVTYYGRIYVEVE